MIDVENLTKQYAGRTAVNNISFQVEPGAATIEMSSIDSNCLNPVA